MIRYYYTLEAISLSNLYIVPVQLLNEQVLGGGVAVRAACMVDIAIGADPEHVAGVVGVGFADRSDKMTRLCHDDEGRALW